MQTRYTIEIIDADGIEHIANVYVETWDGMDAVDLESAISEKAIQNASRMGYEYSMWEYSQEAMP